MFCQIRGYSQRVADLESDLSVNNERNKQGLAELSSKEEELVVLRVELTSLKEKLKNKANDLEKSKSEYDLLKSRSVVRNFV